MINVAGVDPSTKSGVVVLKETGDVQASKEVTHKTLKGLYRADHIAGAIVADLLSHDVRLVMIEGYAYGNKFTLVPMVEIGTLIRDRLIKAGIEYLDVPPTKLKKFVAGKGNVKKEDMKLHVFKRWGFEGTNNEVDAYGLAQMARCSLGIQGEFTKDQIKAVHTCAQV